VVTSLTGSVLLSVNPAASDNKPGVSNAIAMSRAMVGGSARWPSFEKVTVGAFTELFASVIWFDKKGAVRAAPWT